VVCGGTAERDQDAADVDSERDEDHDVHEPVRLERLAATGQSSRRLDHYDYASSSEDGRLPQSRQVLSAPMAVGMISVGGTATHADRE